VAVGTFRRRPRLGIGERVRRVLIPSLVHRLTSAYFGSDPSEDGLLVRITGGSEAVRLTDLFTLYGSDKGWRGETRPPFPWAPHNYGALYEFLFRAKRDSCRVLVECGIGTNHTDVRSNMSATGRPGASLRAWRDYFGEAQVIGVDIDERILFSEDRISTYRVDQLDPASIAAFWAACGVHRADIIIDDGLHTFEAGVSFFEASIHMLADDGIYVIEDVSPERLAAYRAYFSARSEIVDFIQLFRPAAPLKSNSVVVIRRG
jgi:hypothetical protein